MPTFLKDEGYIMKLLYAEDEKALSDAVTDILSYHKYIVDAVYNGADALDYAKAGGYDGIILDIMMPKKSGLDVLIELRKSGVNTPIMLLTAKAEVEDCIEGLDLGADDYLTKPFAMGELLARVRAMLRRRENFRPDTISFGDIVLDMRNFELSCCGNSVILPKQEYRLMEQLVINNDCYLSAEDLLSRVWGYDSEAEVGNVWLYVSYLRKRLASMGSKVVITNKRNIGYRLEEI